MLTLITGVPGSGKTAYVVDQLLDQVGKRIIFSDGIKGLEIPHEKVPHIDEWVEHKKTESGADEYEWLAFPPNSLIVIDECQRLFRPRHSTAKVPPVVAGFETHRHAGLDFWLLTQDSSFLDPNVRKLLDRHIHIQDSWLGRFTYTWLKEGDPKSKSSLDSASRKKYVIPKRAFDKYKSAEVHTEKKKPIPLVLPLGLLALLILPVLAWRVVDSVTSRGDKPDTAEITPAPASEPQKGDSHNKHPLAQFEDSTTWKVMGYLGGYPLRVILTDGQRRRVVLAETFTMAGNSVEIELPEGGKASPWSGLTPDEKK
jgi:zona occludens toxin